MLKKHLTKCKSSFIMKVLSKLGIEENYLNILKIMCHSKIAFSGEKQIFHLGAGKIAQ